ncbi:MAG: peptidylprolyl isomerase [Bacteroidales bacterium]|nr:peptidylprolyl isomerase [Bacteroidales bacterium]
MKIFLLLAIAFTLACCTNNRSPRVIIVTDLGNIEAEIYSDKATVTAANFLRYVDSGKYNNMACFYRVVRFDNQADKKIKIEVIQGGFGQDSLIEKYQFPPIIHETTLKTGILHKDGVLSMARYGPGTASSEFFICVDDQPELDFDGGRNPDKQGFAAFGKVVKGMDIVRKIQLLKDKDQYLEKPLKIISITRIKE